MVLFCKLQDHSREVNSCAFSSEFFVTCSGDKNLRIYKNESFVEVPYSPLKLFKYGINSVTFNNDGSLLSTGDTDGKAHVFRLTASSYEIVAIFDHSSVNTVQVTKFSPDSKHLISGSSDGSIALWSVSNKHLIKMISGHGDGYVYAADFESSGGYLATGSALGDIRIWNMLNREMTCILQIEAHGGGDAGCGVSWLAFSPKKPNIDSNILASCGQDSIVNLWLFNLTDRSLNKISSLRGHTSAISCCNFSPDGTKVASSSFDKTVILWDTESGEKVLILEGHTAIVTSVAFSVDGRTLASTSYDKSSLIWKINEDEDEDHHRRLNLISPEAESPSKSLIQSSSVPNLDLPEPLNLTSWTCQDVADWLRDSVQLGQYSQIFIDNVIDGVELVTLTSETLKKDLGIVPLGHRNKILRAVSSITKPSKSSFDLTSLSSSIPAQFHAYIPQLLSHFKDHTGGNQSAVEWASTSNQTNPAVKVHQIRKRKQEIEKKMPAEFFCPISHELMEDPVLASDGFTYERSFIENWLNSKGTNCCSPMTNQPLSSRSLVPNQALKALIMQSCQLDDE